MTVLLLHGPNLNLLGEREKSTYGTLSSEALVEKLRNEFPGVTIDYFQSNHESELVDRIQGARHTHQGILINAGAFSHTSVAIADAVRSVPLPSICVHITNIYKREAYRHTDLVGEACRGAIVGLGTEGYTLAMECLLEFTGQD